MIPEPMNGNYRWEKISLSENKENNGNIEHFKKGDKQ